MVLAALRRVHCRQNTGFLLFPLQRTPLRCVPRGLGFVNRKFENVQAKRRVFCVVSAWSLVFAGSGMGLFNCDTKCSGVVKTVQARMSLAISMSSDRQRQKLEEYAASAALVEALKARV